MNFIDAVKTCFKKYASFNGRASRSEFWFFVLFYYAVVILSIVLMIQTNSYGFFMVFIFVFAIVSLLPYLAVAVRRLHDTNQPGTLVGVALIVSFLSRIPGLHLVGIISLGLNIIIFIMCAKDGDKKNNRFGKNIYKKRKKRR